MIPKKIIASRIKKATSVLLTAISSSEPREISVEIQMVATNTIVIQRIVLIRSFFAEAGSDLDTTINPFMFKIKMTITGGINLTA